MAPMLSSDAEKFSLIPQELFLVNMIICTMLYVVISLAGNYEHNMEKMLHRGEYAVEGESIVHYGEVSRFKKCSGITSEFTFRDRLIVYAMVGWFTAWLLVFVVRTIYGFIGDPSDQQWLSFWHIYLGFLVVLTAGTTVWFTVGGVQDLKAFFQARR